LDYHEYNVGQRQNISAVDKTFENVKYFGTTLTSQYSMQEESESTANSGCARQSVQNLLLPLLSKNKRLKY
jgi:hypothetical protein